MTMKENDETSTIVSEEKISKQNEQKKEEPQTRKLPTIEEIQKRKKVLVHILLVLVFIGVMYWIFAPSKAEKEKLQTEQGINVEIPEISGGELPEDKGTAYKLAENEQKENERQWTMGTLSDFFVDTKKSNNRLEEWESFADPNYRSGKGNEISRSASAYGDIRNTLGNFYEENSQMEILQQQIDDLQAQLDDKNRLNDEDREIQRQLELMEKSYEMAARYLPQNQQATTPNPFETAVEREMDEPVNAHVKVEAKEPVLKVYPDVETVVSSLYQEVSDSVFMAEQMQERNHYFLSDSESRDELPNKNTLKVSVYETVTLKDGETVQLRLLESARISSMLIPKNTLLTAMAKIQGNRLSLSVTSIEHRERIISVNLSAYDLDGQPGVFIPHSTEMNAVKEVVAGMGQSAGTSFTFNSSAGQQLAADAGKGVMQGASQYINKKMREVKVTLKSGHKLFLMQHR